MVLNTSFKIVMKRKRVHNLKFKGKREDKRIQEKNKEKKSKK